MKHRRYNLPLMQTFCHFWIRYSDPQKMRRTCHISFYVWSKKRGAEEISGCPWHTLGSNPTPAVGLKRVYSHPNNATKILFQLQTKQKKGEFAGDISTLGRVQISPDPFFNSADSCYARAMEEYYAKKLGISFWTVKGLFSFLCNLFPQKLT